MLKVLSLADLARAGMVAVSALPGSRCMGRMAANEVGNPAQCKEESRGRGRGRAGGGEGGRGDAGILGEGKLLFCPTFSK